MPFIYNLSPHFIKITDSHSNAHFYIIIDESFESVSLYKKKKKNLQSSIFSTPQRTIITNNCEKLNYNYNCKRNR